MEFVVSSGGGHTYGTPPCRAWFRLLLQRGSGNTQQMEWSWLIEPVDIPGLRMLTWVASKQGNCPVRRKQ